ncbi:hypothetical protein EPK99_11380 [Neorhizobium lilium]|uniref:Uncharacterized protein n=1 Tax=Neorhizobium lilium TaxID=2503024 RepID=A0A444LJE4_9HYPH|nr:hypothetical protein [Neorhizobium lilium]RWX79160.1 hypothetical protein EPK99_11380 [Neorhizobium lilium]
MPMESNGPKEAVSTRLQRIEDDLERLYSLEQTPAIAAAIAALVSEAEDLRRSIVQIDDKIMREKIKLARALRYRSMRLGDIAEKVGLSKTSVQRVCRDIPVDRRASPRLVPPIWLDKAKSMEAEGKTRRVIALELGIPMANFYRAYNRFTGHRG